MTSTTEPMNTGAIQGAEWPWCAGRAATLRADLYAHTSAVLCHINDHLGFPLAHPLLGFQFQPARFLSYVTHSTMVLRKVQDTHKFSLRLRIPPAKKLDSQARFAVRRLRLIPLRASYSSPHTNRRCRFQFRMKPKHNQS